MPRVLAGIPQEFTFQEWTMLDLNERLTRADIVAKEPSASRCDGSSADSDALLSAVERYIAQLELRVPAMERRHKQTSERKYRSPAKPISEIPKNQGNVATVAHILRAESDGDRDAMARLRVPQAGVLNDSDLWTLHNAPVARHDDLNFRASSVIWHTADANDDGMMSCSESKEIVRAILACTALRQVLGKILYSNCVEVMRRDERARLDDFARGQEKDHVLAKILTGMEDFEEKIGHDGEELHVLLRLCEHSVRHACLGVAPMIPAVTAHFWQAMDIGLDQEVDAKEFKFHFQKAMIAHIIPPVWRIAEERIRAIIAADAWRSQSIEELNHIMKGYKVSQLRLKLVYEVRRNPPKQENKNNCGVCDIRQLRGDCVVM